MRHIGCHLELIASPTCPTYAASCSASTIYVLPGSTRTSTMGALLPPPGGVLVCSYRAHMESTRHQNGIMAACVQLQV